MNLKCAEFRKTKKKFENHFVESNKTKNKICKEKHEPNMNLSTENNEPERKSEKERKSETEKEQ